MNIPVMSAVAYRKAFMAGDFSAREIALSTLQRIQENAALNAFVEVTQQRMLREAEHWDQARRRGDKMPALAAVPYAVKNLFDVQGITTLAGAKVLSHNPPAAQDSVLGQRMQANGGLLAGTLNMDALAYGFTTENTHYGATYNPREVTRSAGGSSGGSGAAVAAGLVPISLGSDTNGSIRVPASLCGIYGLKPTYGRLPRSGSFPFVGSLDHLGPFAANPVDLALAYDALQGPDAADPACAQRTVETSLEKLALGMQGLRVARLGGYFDTQAGAIARQASHMAAKALGATDEVAVDGVEVARAAAFVMTATEGGQLHLNQLRTHLEEFEPLSRDRLLAGTLVPAAWLQQAQIYRRVFLQRVLQLFQSYDLLIAPATPVTAPQLGQLTIEINGRTVPTRPNMGLLTQPISFIGLPVAVAPLWPEGPLPIGVQLIAAPWCEDICLRAAQALTDVGVATSLLERV